MSNPPTDKPLWAPQKVKLISVRNCGSLYILREGILYSNSIISDNGI